ncbi:MAG: B12-binding domain-containing radical SAM protein [Planctomycetota bacterium]|nr:B12-binding domain-containing radical SAM protein [Planctomycetota bacterium]
MTTRILEFEGTLPPGGDACQAEEATPSGLADGLRSGPMIYCPTSQEKLPGTRTQFGSTRSDLARGFMRALLINPEFPNSYWSAKEALVFTGRRTLIPPLGLITVAALLPDHWECRLVDTTAEALTDEDLRWADVAMVTGMLVQREALHEILARCRRLGLRTVVGGPYATALPEELDGADHVVVGEAEEIIPDLAADLEGGYARHIYKEVRKPDLSQAPLPRFDLLKTHFYHNMALQFSRGCPFTCEFCDIIVMYGRKPRTKTAAQVIRELDAIQTSGFVGNVFFVDDNFIGNKKAVRQVLPEIGDWRRRTKAKLEFYTEASMNVADDPSLVDLMIQSGFTAIFIGIETPSAEALRETKKLQNLKRDMAEQVHGLLEKGMDVWAGFILGFDSDGPDIFDQMIEFVNRAAIPYAMVGMLSALPHTPLYHRLEKEGRLREGVSGDQFGLTNVVTKLPVDQMVSGYRRVLETLYDPSVFFDRCREYLRWYRTPSEVTRPKEAQDVRAVLRAMVAQGLRSPYRREYWRFLRWVLFHCPRQMGRALALAAAGHHYITYTRESVVPGLRRAEEQIREGRLSRRVDPHRAPRTYGLKPHPVFSLSVVLARAFALGSSIREMASPKPSLSTTASRAMPQGRSLTR